VIRQRARLALADAALHGHASRRSETLKLSAPL